MNTSQRAFHGAAVVSCFVSKAEILQSLLLLCGSNVSSAKCCALLIQVYQETTAFCYFQHVKNRYATYISSLTVIPDTSALLLHAESLPPSSRTLSVFCMNAQNAPALWPCLNYRCKKRIYERYYRMDGFWKWSTGPHEQEYSFYFHSPELLLRTRFWLCTSNVRCL